MKEFKGMNRNNVARYLKRAGYDWQIWNEDGTVLDASKTGAGVTIDRIIVNFSKKGRALAS